MKNNCSCNKCGKEIYKKPCYLKIYKKHYCDQNCAKLDNIRSKIIKCNNCHNDIRKNLSSIERAEKLFCSRDCANKIISYKNGKFKKYRKKALETFGLKCQNPDCVITNSGIELESHLFDVDHINGDRTNCDINNLQVLCLYCHAVKTRTKKEIVRKT